MEQLISAVLTNLDIETVREDLEILDELALTLDEIKDDIEAVKPNISFWDKVNFFSSTGHEEELKEYKSELKSHKSLHKQAIIAIKECISDAIHRTYSVRLKLQLSELEKAINNISAHSHGKGMASVSGRGKALKQLGRIDDEFSERFGLMPGAISEKQVVNAVFQHLLSRSTY